MKGRAPDGGREWAHHNNRQSARMEPRRPKRDEPDYDVVGEGMDGSGSTKRRDREAEGKSKKLAFSVTKKLREECFSAASPKL